MQLLSGNRPCRIGNRQRAGGIGNQESGIADARSPNKAQSISFRSAEINAAGQAEGVCICWARESPFILLRATGVCPNPCVAESSNEPAGDVNISKIAGELLSFVIPFGLLTSIVLAARIAVCYT